MVTSIELIQAVKCIFLITYAFFLVSYLLLSACAKRYNRTSSCRLFLASARLAGENANVYS